jgi:predicted RNA-binding protein
MCLSTAWGLGEQGDKRMLCEYVSSISVGRDAITLTDLMGRETIVSGSLESVDLVKNAINIKVYTKNSGLSAKELANSLTDKQLQSVIPDIRRMSGNKSRGKQA